MRVGKKNRNNRDGNRFEKTFMRKNIFEIATVHAFSHAKGIQLVNRCMICVGINRVEAAAGDG